VFVLDLPRHVIPNTKGNFNCLWNQCLSLLELCIRWLSTCAPFPPPVLFGFGTVFLILEIEHKLFIYCEFDTNPFRSRLGLRLWCLMPLSTIFQIYRGGQFYWWRKRSTRSCGLVAVDLIWIIIIIYNIYIEQYLIKLPLSATRGKIRVFWSNKTKRPNQESTIVTYAWEKRTLSIYNINVFNSRQNNKHIYLRICVV
jgi:hypothetical protein